MMNHSEVLEKALEEGKQRHPEAPDQHHSAFANSVAYLVTGASGGFGGPSCREHAVSYSAMLQGGSKQTIVGGMNAFIPGTETTMPGQWEFDVACSFAEPLCFGELQDVHFQCYRLEHCFDDAPQDVEALKNWRQVKE